MAETVNAKQRGEAKWARIFKGAKSFYSDYNTIDPLEVEAAWEHLSRDSVPAQVALLPAILEGAFLQELKEKKLQSSD